MLNATDSTANYTANHSIQDSWTVIETMTASMKNSADGQNWFDVVERAAARHSLVMAHFDQFPVGPENAEFYRERLGTMLIGEQDLQNLVRNARKSLMSEGAMMTHGHRAVGAYLDSARG
ncbi:MAG: hypothetical protein JWM78_1331 [Verrucomicrobiaceae bacterium]|nr:hypothetical protein [Verrucomicrobiaceae bacterium]